MAEIYYSNAVNNYVSDDKCVDLEAKICSGIAKTIKSMVAKGPTSTRAVMTDDCVLVSLSGFLLPSEKLLGQTKEGFFDVKFNRIKLVHVFKDQLIEIVSAVVQKKISVFLYDLDPAADYAVLIFKY